MMGGSLPNSPPGRPPPAAEKKQEEHQMPDNAETMPTEVFSPPAPAAHSPDATFAERMKGVFIGSFGNMIEWYDFYAYSAFSIYFANSFFPGEEMLAQQLNAALLFALGFVVRPLGGWFFGHLADRRGRRMSLTISIVAMCCGSLMIAANPGYASIGGWAPVLLGLARILQGLSLGGEYGTSATYLAEISDRRNRGFYSSFQYVTLIGGQLCAILVLLILQQAFRLTPEDLRAGGWRIPFVIGGALALFGVVIRRQMPESASHLALSPGKPKISPLSGVLRHPREVMVVAGLTMGGTAAFYTYAIYMQKFLKLSVKLSDNQTTLVTAAVLVFAMLLQPVYGAISDRIGRKWLLIGFGVAGTLFTVPLLRGIQSAQGPFEAFLLLAAAWLIVTGYTSVNAVVKAELFPPEIRATGVGLPYAITVSLFGGTAEPIALLFKKSGHEGGFYWYLTACIALSLLVYVRMRDTRRNSALDAE
jgi:MHS family alpha-ketoglutarate permease-like MFS transporter